MGSVQCIISFVLAVGGFNGKEKILYNINYECGNNFLNICRLPSLRALCESERNALSGLLSLFAKPPNPQLHLPVQHSPTTMTLHSFCPRCLQSMLCF